MHKQKATKIFWTGGWDSTFRVMELLIRYQQQVQPVYILDSNRSSLALELKTMEIIRENIQQKFPKLYKLLLPSHYINLKELNNYKDIDKKYQKILKNGYVGVQVKYFARYIRDYNIISVEIGVHKDDKLYIAISKYGGVSSHKGSAGEYFAINMKDTLTPISICDGMRFPIFKLTKKDMHELSCKWGFEDIMKTTWFCHKPLEGNIPCGRCNPCKYTKEESMGWRIPKCPRIKSLNHKIKRLHLK